MRIPCRPIALAAWLAGMLALSSGCAKRNETAATMSARTDFATPARDVTDSCAEVTGNLRVCWGAADGPGCAAGICVVDSPMPAVVASPLGFRCSGSGQSRRCRDRSLDAPAFRCDGATCTQRHPRLPDDGEWECAAVAGAVVCRGGEPPAGVPKGSIDPGFVCGERRTRGRATGERICVDLSPDFPGGSAATQRCRFDSEQGLTRVCQADPSAHSLGDACNGSVPCVDGARCVAGRCVPLRAEPSCWAPQDCDHGTCRFGTCTEDAL